MKREQTIPARFPTSVQHVDISLTTRVEAEWSFKTLADRQAFDALEPAEREQLRRAFDGMAAGMIEQGIRST